MSEEAFKWLKAYAQKKNEVSFLEKKIPSDVLNRNEYYLKVFEFDSADMNGVANYKCELLRSYAKMEGIDISKIRKIPNLHEKSVLTESTEMTNLINEEKTMAKVKYNDKQVAVFQKFIRAGYGIEEVKNPEFNEKQLKELYLGKKAGLDISLYCSPKISAEEMKELRRTAASGVDLQKIAETVIHTGDYNTEQTLQILDAAKHGVSFENMLNPELDHLQMRQIKLGECYGIDTSIYATTDFSAEQMQSLRLELTVQKVIERIKEFFKERWDSILEWAGRKKITPEMAEEINDIVSAQSPKGIVEQLISESSLTVIAAKVYNKVSTQILEGEKEIENETVQSTTELAEEASADMVQEQQEEAGEKTAGEQQQQSEAEVMVETSSGKMPLREHQEMTAYQKGYDSYEDMMKEIEGIDQEAAYGNPPPEEEYFDAEEYLG
ncbi:MAG: hypothetical protein HDT44_05075 [Ruminococcaceae bacterium]|nr:hypothetical protein [Oscillospiraceae bacterium]